MTVQPYRKRLPRDAAPPEPVAPVPGLAVTVL
jgi:hypothetical protein